MHSGKKLFRNQRERMIAGVCAGIADYFAVDVVFVRLAFAAATIFTGVFPGIIVYVLAIIIVPPEPIAAPHAERAHTAGSGAAAEPDGSNDGREPSSA